jgi:hypothetical protein
MRHVLPPGREESGGGFASGVLFLSVGVAERRPAGRSSDIRRRGGLFCSHLLKEFIFLFSKS